MWMEQHYADYWEVSAEGQGVWYGIWNEGRYTIAKLSEEISNTSLVETEIPAGTYAVFKSGVGGYAGIEISKLREVIFDSWLQDSNYKQVGDFEIEVYHLYPKSEKQKRYYELWIPVDLK